MSEPRTERGDETGAWADEPTAPGTTAGLAGSGPDQDATVALPAPPATEVQRPGRTARRDDHGSADPAPGAVAGATVAYEPGMSGPTLDMTAPGKLLSGTASTDLGATADGFVLADPAPRPKKTGTAPAVAGYEILGELGRGGMGVVYKARQVRLDRLVALKMILAGSTARPEDLARFEAEAIAVAHIEHPNIVRIHEVGEHDGLPFFSLEYLSGGTLAGKIGGKPRPVDEAARCLETLARAMGEAHRQGIVHRDLKPANVLIAADGSPKITDFGLVKRLEADSGNTQSGSILGTPSYMAPEQARGEGRSVGPAADQYALGAILYELLTGRPPFQGASILDTLEMVRSQDPVPPSRLQPKVPPDLETVCLKCLQKEPERRYADAAALAEDLRRFLAGEPILARPVSGAERLWRWCRRNPRVAALAATVALLLVAVTAVSAWAAETLRGKNRALVTANAAVEAKRKVAEAAVRVANAHNLKAVEAEIDMISLLEDTLRNEPKLQAVRGNVLGKAMRNLDASARVMNNIRRDVGWEPAVEDQNMRTLARAYQRLGELSLSLNQLREGLGQFREADAIVERLAAKAPDNPAAQARLARSQRLLGYLSMTRLSDTEGGERYFHRALEINRACLVMRPGEDTFKQELANTLGQLAEASRRLGRLDAARRVYDQEIAVRESFSPAKANEFEVRNELSGLYEKLAELSLQSGDKDEGRRLYQRCSAIREALAAERPDVWPVLYNLSRSYNNFGFLHFPQGDDPAGARHYHRKALALLEARAAADPENTETQRQLAETLYFDATCALKLGKTADAEAGYRRCLNIRKALAADPRTKMSEIDLMVALARCGEHVQAARLAASLVETEPRDAQVYFQAACGYALAAAAAKDGRGAEPPAADRDLARAYTDAAVDCLRKARARGWADAGSLETDPDLEPVRGDPKFRALVDEIRKPPAPAAAARRS